MIIDMSESNLFLKPPACHLDLQSVMSMCLLVALELLPWLTLQELVAFRSVGRMCDTHEMLWHICCCLRDGTPTQLQVRAFLWFKLFIDC